jgi:chemotaxis family two-component system response regulator PixH
LSTALIVEDCLTEQAVLSSCLQRGGLTVLTAKNAEEAIAKINANKLDVIILDIVLPDRSGFEICRDLKSEIVTSNIPIVICSTKGGEMDKFWGMKQGANAYLVKPIDQDELVRIVKGLIRN